MSDNRIVTEDALHVAKLAKKWFGGDPYIIFVGRRYFLILAHPKVSKGEWFKNGVPQTFTYMERTVVASGGTFATLFQSLREYHRLSRLSNTSLKSIAKTLGRRGGLKGGPARAKALTPDQRSESAKNAARARWKGVRAPEQGGRKAGGGR
jgi:hypothetical protein